jgi:hypothetical protein
MSRSHSGNLGSAKKRSFVHAQDWQVRILRTLYEQTCSPSAQQRLHASLDTGLYAMCHPPNIEPIFTLCPFRRSEDWIGNWFARQRRSSRSSQENMNMPLPHKRRALAGELGPPVAKRNPPAFRDGSSQSQVSRVPISKPGLLPSVMPSTTSLSKDFPSTPIRSSRDAELLSSRTTGSHSSQASVQVANPAWKNQAFSDTTSTLFQFRREEVNSSVGIRPAQLTAPRTRPMQSVSRCTYAEPPLNVEGHIPEIPRGFFCWLAWYHLF